MSKKDKLIKRIMGLDKNLRKDEIIKAMESLGYKPEYPSRGSSHCTFRKKGRNPITIPFHGSSISIVYLKTVRDTIELEEEKEQKGGNEDGE